MVLRLSPGEVESVWEDQLALVLLIVRREFRQNPRWSSMANSRVKEGNHSSSFKLFTSIGYPYHIVVDSGQPDNATLNQRLLFEVFF